jgi:murein tripeptide amidase MpaA
MKYLLLSCFTFLLTAAVFPQNWQTKFEKSDSLETPKYKETMEYFHQFTENSDYAKMFSFGLSPQGRDLNCLIISKDKAFTPEEAKKTGKPVILIINGIHSGEIEGKDACMLLLRDILITKEKQNYLDKVIIMVVPIFSVDAHERWSKYNRINQNGPEEMGWRTTSQGLNLNRDWVKADAPEMQSMLKLFSTWLPDFFVDTHTTDGADYQYSLTYGMDTRNNIYSELADFNKNKFIPFLKSYAEKKGFLVAPYITFKTWQEGFESGLTEGVATPRYSNCYASAQNRPGLLVETHMLKPYKERVMATKAALEAVVEFCSANNNELLRLNKRADENMINEYAVQKHFLPVSYELTDKTVLENIKGKAYTKTLSDISGGTKITYYNRDTTFDVPVYRDAYVTDSVQAPAYYLIPQEWKLLVDRLALHGIKYSRLDKDETHEVTRYRFLNVKYDDHSTEGRQRVSFDVESYKETTLVPAGTYKIETAQRSVALILHMLEPKAGDSFVKWGFMNTIFETKEYFENYVMEKIAVDMLKNNPALKTEFESKLASDEAFKNNPDARLLFFYQRSPYFDKQYRVYPIMRVE